VSLWRVVPRKREILLLLSVGGRNIVRTIRDCRRSNTVSFSSHSPEMKRDDRFAKSERHRLAEFVIYSDFDRIEFSAFNRYVMRSIVGMSHDIAVLTAYVADT
jgi:hypothetical protein